jgi:hypothetical protein
VYFADDECEWLGMQMFKFIGGTQKDLHRKGFVEMDYATVGVSAFLFSSSSSSTLNLKS